MRLFHSRQFFETSGKSTAKQSLLVLANVVVAGLWCFDKTAATEETCGYIKTAATEETCDERQGVTGSEIGGQTNACEKVTDCSALKRHWYRVFNSCGKKLEVFLVLSPGDYHDCCAWAKDGDSKECVQLAWNADIGNGGCIWARQLSPRNFKWTTTKPPPSLIGAARKLKEFAATAYQWDIVNGELVISCAKDTKFKFSPTKFEFAPKKKSSAPKKKSRSQNSELLCAVGSQYII